MSNAVIDGLQLVLSLISPILVAWIGYISNKTQKENKRIQELQTEINDKNEKELNETIESLKSSVENINRAIDILTKEVNELKEGRDTRAIQEQIKTMIAMVNINFEYCQALSEYTVNMGDSLSSQELTSNNRLNEAVREYKDKEKELTHRIYKILY